MKAAPSNKNTDRVRSGLLYTVRKILSVPAYS